MQDFDTFTFLIQGGPVSMAVAAILVVMSVASWSLLLTKIWQGWKANRSGLTFIQSFYGHHTHEQHALDAAAKAAPGDNDYAGLTRQGVEAGIHYKTHSVSSCSQDEFVARALQRGLQEAQARMESGLTVLASVGSVAPFVGLFGTVWGIYHALASISVSGQASLDKVAGPVGESLIMTAFGLAVAIPAVLAYNGLVRRNRNAMAQLEAYAYHLHVYLTTGQALPAARTDAAFPGLRQKEATA